MSTHERVTPDDLPDLPRRHEADFGEEKMPADRAAMKRGFSSMSLERRPMREDADGTTYEGELWTRGGFLPRNYGSWER